MAERKKKRRKRDEEAFIRGVVVREEAVEPAEDGSLPPGATHEIVEEPVEDDALPEIRRRRFSAF